MNLPMGLLSIETLASSCSPKRSRRHRSASSALSRRRMRLRLSRPISLSISNNHSEHASMPAPESLMVLVASPLSMEPSVPCKEPRPDAATHGVGARQRRMRSVVPIRQAGSRRSLPRRHRPSSGRRLGCRALPVPRLRQPVAWGPSSCARSCAPSRLPGRPRQGS